MARDADALLLRKWAAMSALVQTPEAAGITRADGLPASYGVDTFLTLEVFNQIWREITGAAQELARHGGILEWHVRQQFDHPGWCTGSDGNLYRTVQSSLGVDPVTDADRSHWQPFTTSVPNSSTTARGIIRTATTAEGRAGTGTTPALTPAGLAALVERLLPTAPELDPRVYLTAGSYSFSWPWATPRARIVLVSGTLERVGRQERLSGQDINLSDSRITTGAASDGTTIWFIDYQSLNVDAHAYTVVTRARDASKDFNVNNFNTQSEGGATSDGTTIWIIDNIERSVGQGKFARAFRVSTRVSDSSKDISLGAGNFYGAAIAGNTLWFLNNTTNTLVAYNATTLARTSARDISLGDFLWYGAASDGQTVWVLHDNSLLAYNASTRARDSARDIDLEGIGTNWRSVVIVNGILWVVDGTANYARAFRVSVATDDGETNVKVGSATYSVAARIPQRRSSQEIAGISVGDTINVMVGRSGGQNLEEGLAVVSPVYR